MLFTDPDFLFRVLPVLLVFYFLAVALTVRGAQRGSDNAAGANWVLAFGGIALLVVGAGHFAWLVLAVTLVNCVAARVHVSWLSRWVVTLDAMATSGLMLVATTLIFTWWVCVRLATAVMGLGR